VSVAGPNSPATRVDVGDFGSAWANLGNLAASDDAYATCDIVADGISNTLRVTGFGFAIPAGARILGIVVDVEWVDATGNVAQASYGLQKNGTPLGNPKGTNQINTTESYESVGSSSDLWGTTVTETDVNDANFGLNLQWTNGNGVSNRTVSVDHVRMTVYYDVPQVLRPDADVATTGWATAPLFSKVNEVTADGTVITGTAA
jgi:hypothetical protein